jgi:hypothetical protein
MGRWSCIGAFSLLAVITCIVVILYLLTEGVACDYVSFAPCGWYGHIYFISKSTQRVSVKFYIWSLYSFYYGVLNFFVCRRWRKTEVSWTDIVRNEVVLHGVKEERNILHTIEGRKANWIGRILSRNCRLRHVFKWKVEEGLKWREDEVEDLSSYWMRFRKERIPYIEGGSTRSHSLENALEETEDLPWDRRQSEWPYVLYIIFEANLIKYCISK